MGLSHGDGDIPDRAHRVEAIRRAHGVTPLSAAQSIYSMVERGVVEAIIPYCLENHIGFVPFSPIARGFLSGKVTGKTDFSHSDDVRKYIPQLRPENLGARNVALIPPEFAALEDALAGIPVRGHRGFVERQGGSMKNWCKNNASKSLRPSRGLFLFSPSPGQRTERTEGLVFTLSTLGTVEPTKPGRFHGPQRRAPAF